MHHPPLHPCKCGAEVEMYEEHITLIKDIIKIKCPACGFGAYSFSYHKKQLIEMWNREKGGKVRSDDIHHPTVGQGTDPQNIQLLTHEEHAEAHSGPPRR